MRRKRLLITPLEPGKMSPNPIYVEKSISAQIKESLTPVILLSIGGVIDYLIGLMVG